jgi:hypothetical protein
MQLDNKFKAIMDHLANPGPSHYSGDKQVYYLTYDPSRIIEVKRNLSNWLSLAKGYQYNCAVLSLSKLMNDFFRNNPRRSKWAVPDTSDEYSSITEFFKDDLGSMIIENRVIESAILNEQKKMVSIPNPLLILTDLEAIHPFTRLGPVEQNVYNEIEIPLLILYPGSLSGSSLEFLGFYPPDGNYRSKHF